MNRRQFLTGAAVLGLAGQDARASSPGRRERFDPAREAERLTGRMQAMFWDAAAGMYRAPVRSAETVDSDPRHNNGYVFWPSIEAFRALAAGEGVRPGRYREAIRQVYRGLEGYFDPERHAYNAWLSFPGNNDKYYDDNALAVISLVEAFRNTGEPAYRDRAAEVLREFLRGGWDATGRPGGMRWGTDPSRSQTGDKAACATSTAALGALLLAGAGVDRSANIEWARELLAWLKAHLQDADGLIMDALEPPDWKVRRVKWTYNTGLPLQAWVEVYRLTGDKAALAEARRLSRASLDRRGALYDSLVREVDQRYLYDSGFFTAYLVDAWVALHRVAGDRAALDSARRNAASAYRYVRDPRDGLYFRNWRLWRIGEERHRACEFLYGQTFPLEPDADERSKERRYESVPPGERPLVKTLLANAGHARLFWALAGAGKRLTGR